LPWVVKKKEGGWYRSAGKEKKRSTPSLLPQNGLKKRKGRRIFYIHAGGSDVNYVLKLRGKRKGEVNFFSSEKGKALSHCPRLWTSRKKNSLFSGGKKKKPSRLLPDGKKRKTAPNP